MAIKKIQWFFFFFFLVKSTQSRDYYFRIKILISKLLAICNHIIYSQNSYNEIKEALLIRTLWAETNKCDLIQFFLAMK